MLFHSVGTYAEFIGYFLIFLVFVIAFFQNRFGGVGQLFYHFLYTGYPFFAFAEVIVGFFLRYSFVEVGILFFYQ